jgi:glycerol-3-phosphate dehydrogenase
VIAEKLTSAPVLSRHVIERVQADLSRAPRASRDPSAAGVGRSIGASASAARGRNDRSGVARAIDHDAMGAVAPEVEARLRSRYGERWRAPLEHAPGRADWLQPVAPGCPALGVEVVHAIRSEWARTVDDVVLRRLGLGALARVPAGVRAAVAAHVTREVGADQAATGTGSR